MENNDESLLPKISTLLKARDIQKLIHILESPAEDILHRRHAVIALGEIGGEEAVPFLIRALNDEDHFLPYAALTALGKIGLPAFSHMLKFLKETENEKLVEWSAKTAFRGAGGNALNKLKEFLANAPDSRSRRNAAIVLGLLKNKSAAEPLAEALDDEDAEVRSRSAYALGEITSPEAVESLIEKLRDPDDEVRIFSARALGEIGDVRAAEPLIEAMNYNRSWEVQQSAADSLGKIGGKKVVEALALKLKSGDELVGMSAAYSLGEVGNLRALLPLLRASITLGPLTRPVARRSLWYIIKRNLGWDKLWSEHDYK